MKSKAMRIGVASLALAILGLLAPAAQAQDPAMHGRVSFADESALVKGPEDDEWSYADVNTLIFAGDTLWADEAGAVEIEFSRGTFVRMADGSRMDVLDVPPSGLFRTWNGSFYVQRLSRSSGDVVFDTPVGAIHIDPDTQVRVDVLEEGATTVSVRWGSARIHTEVGGAVEVRAGERSYIDPGYLPSEPVRFDRSYEDEFDSWNRLRARRVALGSQPTPIHRAAEDYPPIGVYDLNDYGEWVYIDGDPYWRPTVIVNYVPYRRGYWSYVPAHGYVWVGYYPFSYVTTHYGYWRYHHHHGWIWSYDHHYRPAYAYTVHYGDRFVWAPLGIDGYPVYHSTYAGFTIGDVHFSFAFSSFSYDRYVFSHHHFHHVHALRYHHIYDAHHRHLFHDPTYWRIAADPTPYINSPRPHWPTDRVRTFTPQTVVRGATRLEDGSVRAGDRVNALQTRYERRSFTPRRPDERSVRTPTADRIRQANVRRVEVRSPARDRAVEIERERGIRTPSDVPRTRTYTNRDARGAEPLSRGSITERGPATRTERTPRVDTPGRPPDTERRIQTERERTRIPTTTPSRERQPEARRPESRERPQVIRPDQSRTTRPDVTRPESRRPASTTERQPSQPQVRRPTPSERPSVTRPDTTRRTAPRPDPSQGPDVGRREVAPPSSANRRFSTQPRGESPQRQVAPRSPSRDSATIRPRTGPSISRSTTRAPSRVAPAPQPRSYSTSPRASQPSPRQTTSVNRGYTAPSPPRVSTPSRGSTPARSYSSTPPSRPSRSTYSAPSSSGRSSFSAPSRPSRSSGPSRSRSPR